MKSLELLVIGLVAVISVYFGYQHATTKKPEQVVNENVLKIVNGSSWATGFAIKEGYLVTASHICEQLEQDGHLEFETVGTKRILAVDDTNDLCLLEGDNRFNGLTLQVDVKEMDNIFSIGYSGSFNVKSIRYGNVSQKGNVTTILFPVLDPLTFEICLSKGMIQQNFCVKDREGYFTTLFATEGASGSPVVNLEGEVLGVNSAFTNTSEYVFMESSHLKKLISDYEKSIEKK